MSLLPRGKLLVQHERNDHEDEYANDAEHDHDTAVLGRPVGAALHEGGVVGFEGRHFYLLIFLFGLEVG